MEKERKKLGESPSIESQERLIEIMNDAAHIVDFNGTQWEIRALKPGTQWLIAQEAIAINKAETAAYGDVIKQFASNVPSVAKVFALAMLNDRMRIFANGHNGEFSEEFKSVFETLMWDCDQKNWMTLLVEIISLLDIECFFSITSSMEILRQKCLERKMTMEEQKQLLQERSSGK